ncbi:HEAT repeat domain-containing protein [Deinococcus cellulosilyticus]|uniref:HEAT repeat domain-containing protein n=1 Tax=Deinococcus cellulosilyticus (strain DSM 18568 / NBRC 106333 / KACC 11606 / 5516J-15) TaxID=1223518 RepID=A0A511N9Y6_DEIC1|nr:HEAT repeat domain-containing protein [Deinococcus cellulosilyticus]GEM49610.1 hypothetical protein DC3_52450 [Deinococcus cellulosilyticus NBRC 106333 = KACC 11606]
MWRRFGLASLSLLATAIVVVILGTLGGLSYVLLTPELSKQPDLIYQVLIYCVGGGFIAILFTALYETFYFAYTETLQRRVQAEQEQWSEVWFAVLFEDAPLPAKVNEMGADTLMLLKESLKGEASERIREIYAACGLLERDMQAMQGWNLLERRVRVLERWAVLADARTHPVLVEYCLNANPELRRLALLSLARSMSFSEVGPAHVAVTFERLLNLDRFGSGWIEQVLVLLGQGSVKLIQDILVRFPDIMKLRALNALVRLRLWECLPECLPLLRSENPDMRASVLRVFSGLQYVPEEAIEDVLALLKDPVWFVRSQAALACAGISGEEAVSRLYEALADEAWWVRHNSAEVLSQKGPEGVTTLQKAAEVHPDRYARDTASQQLFALQLSH